jgi:hypothetical protein
MMLYNKSRQILTILSLLVFGFHATAQTRIISSYEAEMDYAFGGGAYGLFAKINHQWTQKKIVNFQSGISSAFFIESNALTTSYYDRKGVLFDPHINANSGITFNLFKNKFQIGLDLFGGFYLLRRQGHYTSAVLNFTQDKYMYQESYFNWGTRLTLTYNLNERIGIQLTSNNSFNSWMIFHGTDYSKMFFGIGIIYRPKQNE